MSYAELRDTYKVVDELKAALSDAIRALSAHGLFAAANRAKAALEKAQ